MESQTNLKLDEIKAMLNKQDAQIKALTDLIRQSTNGTNPLSSLNDTDHFPLSKDINPFTVLNTPVPFSMEDSESKKKEKEEVIIKNESLTGGHIQQFYGLLSRHN
jgi:hypothetical protein